MITNIIMKYIITIIKNLLPKKIHKPVGRWRIENCNFLMNHKVDLSNEDHCGPCGQYALEKIKLINNKTDILLEKTKKNTNIVKI